MSSILKIKKLKKTFHKDNIKNEVLQGINMEIKEGSISGIIGESGCGKSTIGKIISGIFSKDSGDIIFQGKELVPLRKRNFKICADIQYIFQDPYAALLNNITVEETLKESIKFCKRNRRECKSVEEVMSMVNLNFSNFKDKYIRELSGGERQRVCIARALITNPTFIIADECTSMLDSKTSDEIYKIIKQVNKYFKVTFFIITHESKVIENICDYLFVINEGKVVDEGTYEELKTKCKSDYTKEYINAIEYIEATFSKGE